MKTKSTLHPDNLNPSYSYIKYTLYQMQTNTHQLYIRIDVLAYIQNCHMIIHPIDTRLKGLY